MTVDAIYESGYRRAIIPARHMNTDKKLSNHLPAIPTTVSLARFHEVVFDRLADVMLHADDVLAMIRPNDESGSLREAAKLTWIEPVMQGIYDDVNELMKSLSDQ